jgi:hypothetical protein
MAQNAPRPRGSLESQRATGLEEFSQTASGPTNKATTEPEQDDHSVPIAWSHIFVSRVGNVGLWIPRCPFCGFEHVHGGYRPYDIRQAFEKCDGRRAPHCHQAPLYAAWGTGCSYQLKHIGGCVRFAPGARRSRAARETTNYLKAIGLETTDETICSNRPIAWWRWR